MAAPGARAAAAFASRGSMASRGGGDRAEFNGATATTSADDSAESRQRSAQTRTYPFLATEAVGVPHRGGGLAMERHVYPSIAWATRNGQLLESLAGLRRAWDPTAGATRIQLIRRMCALQTVLNVEQRRRHTFRARASRRPPPDMAWGKAKPTCDGKVRQARAGRCASGAASVRSLENTSRSVLPQLPVRYSTP